MHRIVAEHFLEKPQNYINVKYEVNHIDFNRKNNCYLNLKWVTHSENIKYSADNLKYQQRNYYGCNNPNYNNHALSAYYKNNPKIAKEKLGRPGKQNGKAVKVMLFDENMNYIETFDWIGGCAEYLISNNYSSSSINAIRDRITVAIKNNKMYLKHYYKRA